MSNILLFSELTESNKNSICKKLFAGMDSTKTLAYIPSSGIQGSESYTAQWKNIADEYGVQFVAVDNISSNGAERDKLLESHTLLISGGNTFQLLHNLRESGLDKTVIEFSHKQNVLLAGFSAGALVLTVPLPIY